MQSMKCPVCPNKTMKRGWHGHVESKAHKAALEKAGLKSVNPDIVSDTETVGSEIKAQLEVVETELAASGSETDARDAYIAALEAERDELREAYNRARPDVSIPIYTMDNVEDQRGLKALRESATAYLAAENRKRMKEGYEPLYTALNGPEYEAMVADRIEVEKREMVDNQTRWTLSDDYAGMGTNTIKLQHPNGNQIQAVVEGQVNNEAAARGVGLTNYRERGFKVIVPYRCQLYNCWEEATTEGRNEFCTAQHAALVDRKVSGVASRAAGPAVVVDGGGPRNVRQVSKPDPRQDIGASSDELVVASSE